MTNFHHFEVNEKGEGFDSKDDCYLGRPWQKEYLSWDLKDFFLKASHRT